MAYDSAQCGRPLAPHESNLHGHQLTLNLLKIAKA
jgi:hypothetical protein